MERKQGRSTWRFWGVSLGMLCIISLLVLPLSTLDAQAPGIKQVPSDPNPYFSPTATTQAQASIVLVSNRYSGPVCIVFTELSRLPAANSPAQEVQYGLFDTTGSSRFSLDGSTASEQQTLVGSFPPDSRKHDLLTLGFLVKVFPATLPPPGTYTMTLRAELFAGSYPPSGAVKDSVLFTISILVGSFYDVSVVAEGGGFSLGSTSTTLAFGTIQQYDTRRADLLVRSNVTYDLSLSSTNSGAFANLSDGTRIPYSLTANGTAVSLASGTRTLLANGTQAGYGTPARFALVIGVLPFTDLPSEGAYSDSLVVTLSAR